MDAYLNLPRSDARFDHLVSLVRTGIDSHVVMARAVSMSNRRLPPLAAFNGPDVEHVESGEWVDSHTVVTYNFKLTGGERRRLGMHITSMRTGKRKGINRYES